MSSRTNKQPLISEAIAQVHEKVNANIRTSVTWVPLHQGRLSIESHLGQHDPAMQGLVERLDSWKESKITLLYKKTVGRQATEYRRICGQMGL